MKLIVGLGNPGSLYANTRHNIGARAVTDLARRMKAVLRRERSIQASSVKLIFDGNPVVLSVPSTYMNLSGTAVGPLVKHYGVDLPDIIVVHDDLDLPFGDLRLRASGSSGGHNGMRSIIAVLGGGGFCRLRIGIGRPVLPGVDPADYVLSPFSRKEKAAVDETVKNACDCLEMWISKGTISCMNIFNR